MVRRFGFVFVMAMGGWVGAAAAADNDLSRGDADACQPDIHRLCDKFFPDEKLVAACLVDRRSELSVACAEVLARPDDAAPARPKSSERADPEPPKP